MPKISRACIADAQALVALEESTNNSFSRMEDRLAVLEMRDDFSRRWGMSHADVLRHAAQYSKRSL